MKPYHCEICGQCPDFRGLVFHHDKFHRSQGGRKMNPDEGQWLCGRCHNLEHNIKEVKSKPMWKEL